jgi:hypothetical protein
MNVNISKLVVYASEGFPSIEIKCQEDAYLGRKYLYTGITIAFLSRSEIAVRRKPSIEICKHILISFHERKATAVMYERLPACLLFFGDV